jgi:Skp family chaperone for outer membrane proteins
MKVFRTTVAVIAVATFAILAHPQTRPTTPASAQPSAPQTRPAAAPGNIAVIDSSAFSDDKQGIGRVMVAMRQLETKFLPLRNELRGMRDRLNTMRADIQKKQAIQDAQTTAKQAEEADKLDLEIKRKAEDAQASYQKESVALLDPLQKDIADALTAYAQAKGISLLFDLNRVPVIYAANNLDITKDFITEYNRTHPAAAVPAGPARP